MVQISLYPHKHDLTKFVLLGNLIRKVDRWKIMKKGEEMEKWKLTHSSIVQLKNSKALQLPWWFPCGSIVTWSLRRRWSKFLFSLKNLVRPKTFPSSNFTKEVDRWKFEVLWWMKSYGTSNLWLQHFN
jgi:hypothetical protein